METSLLLLLSFLRAPLLSSQGKNSSWESRLTQVCLGVKHPQIWCGVERGEEKTGIGWDQMASENSKGGWGWGGYTDSCHPGFLGFILPCKELSSSHRSAEVR